MANLNLTKKSEPHFQKIVFHYAQKKRSLARRTFNSIAIMLGGQLFSLYILQGFNVYPLWVLVVVSIFATILSGPYIGISAMLVYAFIADYFFFEPVGKIFSTQEEVLRIGSASLLGAALSLLIYSFLKQKEEVVRATTLADKALKSRDEMVGIISHELKNPLTNLKLNTGLLQKILPKDSSLEKAREVIAKFSPSIQRMDRLISDLLDVTRIEAESLKIEMKDAALNEIVLDVIDSFKASAQEKNIQLEYDIPPDCRKVFCDEDRTIQIFSNLVSNAIKFIDCGGSISIHAKKNENMVEVEVIDSGKGISEEHLPHVFDRFWQEKNTAHIGTGLGLAIVKGLVEAQGGKLWVKSKLGAGSSFYFTLPQIEQDKKFVSLR